VRLEAVYLSTDISDPVYLVQLRTEKIELAGNSIRPRGLRLPENDETLFVICAPGSGRLNSRTTIDDLPHVGDDIRVRIVSREPGQWLPVGSQWFEPVVPATTTAGQNPPNAGTANSPQVDLRGMTCEAIILEGRLAFAVKSVAAAGPAHDAGFQVGDVVLAVDGQPLNSVAALKEFAAKPTPLKISVVDVNTGQLAQVDLAFAKPSTPTRPDGSPPAEPTNSAALIANALGIEVTESRVGFRKSALTVSKVDPRGAAAESGIEVGDVLMALNDQPTGTAAELAAALPTAVGKATLLVRDVRGGEDVPVEVKIRPTGATKQSPEKPRTDSPAPGSADALGLATELAFYQGEATVRITGVESGSPAARAGLQTGWLILTADGQPVMHPDELKAAEKGSSSRLRLRVADPRTGRESEVVLNR
jgi:S1-C subfamily serine protease